jgi:hypothetical protein
VLFFTKNALKSVFFSYTLLNECVLPLKIFCMIKLLTGQFFIKNENSFSCVETLSSEESLAKVFLVLELPKQDESLLSEIKTIFHTRFWNEEEELLVRFESCMKEVNERMAKKEITSLSGIIAVQDKDELHVSQAGEGEAYIIRRGKLNVIIENMLGEEKEDLFPSIASGKLIVDDKIIFSSLRILRFATASQIIAVCSEGISEGIDTIKDLLSVEAQKGSVMIAHSRGESVFNNSFAPHVSKELRASFFSKIALSFEKMIHIIAEKTQKPHDLVQNIVLGIFVFLISFFLIFFVKNISEDSLLAEKTKLWQENLVKIETEFKKVETQSLLGEVDSANALLVQIETVVKQMLDEGMFRDEGLLAYERIQNYRDSINKITRIKNVSERVRTSFQEDTLLGFTVLQDEIFPYSAKTLYRSVLDHGEKLIDIASEETTVLSATSQPDTQTIYFTLSNGTLAEYSEGILSSSKTLDEEGFVSAVSKSAYSRSLYFLSPENNTIYKYDKQRDIFSKKSSWITEEIDLSQGKDLTIDGSIYVLLNDGGVLLLHKGKQIPLSVQGGSEDILQGASQIYSTINLNHVYFLNTERNSIIRMQKINRGLSFVQEYVFETETPLNSFFVDQNEQRLIVSDSKALYEISL